MIYKGIKTIDVFADGHWYTQFYLNGEIIKTVEWAGKFNADDIKLIIDKEIIPFI